MQQRPPRVAFIAGFSGDGDLSALYSKRIAAFARERSIPLFRVQSGEKLRIYTEQDVTTLEIPRSQATIEIGHGLCFDPLLFMHARRVDHELQKWKTKVIHVTGPGDFGLIGAFAAVSRGTPLAASYSMHLHSFAAEKLHRLIELLPEAYRDFVASKTEKRAVDGMAQFYLIAKILFAPEADLAAKLKETSGKPVYVLHQGVDTTLFQPSQRFRQDGAFTIGYAGGLTKANNVKLLAEVEKALPDGNFKFVVIGAGPEKAALAEQLRRVEFFDKLAGDKLARTFANMDLLLVPSKSEADPAAVLQALASGVPVVTMQSPLRHLIETNRTGYVAKTEREFVAAVHELAGSPVKHVPMRQAAREASAEYTWDRVFERLYEAYAAAAAKPGGLKRAS